MLIPLRPRRSAAAISSAPRPVSKFLAGGGLFSALGKAFYDGVPPIKVPISNVQQAAPIDVGAAWDAADTAGAAVGAKALDGANAAMKEALDKVEMAPAYRGELQARNMDFLKKQQERLAADPAAYNSKSMQAKVMQEAQATLDPTRIMANVNEYKQWSEDEKRLSTDQLADVAIDADGNPLDQSYGNVFSMYRTEESPAVLRQFFPLKNGQKADGSIGQMGTPNRLTLPTGTHQDAYSEVNQLEEKIKPWSTESGDTRFSEKLPSSIKALYEKAGGGAYGVETATNKHSTESNLAAIKAVTSQLATGKTWRTLLSPNAANQLLAEQYREVAKASSNFGQTLGVKNSTLQLEAGGLRLGKSHLEARETLLATLRRPGLSTADQNKIAEAYGKLRAYDLAAAEQNVRNNLIARLGLKKFQATSDVTTRSLDTGGLKPDATKPTDDGVDMRAAVKYGTGLDFMAPNTSYEQGKDKDGKPIMSKGLPYWSAAIPGSSEMASYLQNLTTSTGTDGKVEPRTLQELAANGIGIYNAHSLRGIARPGVNDASLSKIRVAPGGGQFTYLPADPRDLQLAATRDKLKVLEQQATAIIKNLNEAKKTGDPQKIATWEAAKAANLQQATAAGLVPAFRVKMMARQYELGSVPGFANSVDGDYNISKMITPIGSNLFDIPASNSQKTGVRSMSSSEVEKAGLPTGWITNDNYVQFDGYIADPNFHITGSEKSQLRNTSLNNAVQQNNAKQAISGVDAAASESW